MMGLGSYPAVSLVEARRFREKTKAQLRAGTDPLTHQRDQQAAEKEIHDNTLYKVAKDWFTVKQSTVSVNTDRILTHPAKVKLTHPL
jgi:hypothetical protein